jgi:HEAT repeat protein
MHDRRQLAALALISAFLLCVPATAADKTPEERLEQLDSPDPKVRAEAACAIGRMLIPPRRAATALAKALTLEVRRATPASLEEPPTCDCPNEPADPGVRAEWVRACNDLRSEAPHPIPWALRKIGGAKLGVSAVMSMARAEPDLGIGHKQAAHLLAQLGPDAIPEFEKAIEDPDAAIRSIAIRTLPRIRPPTWHAEKALRKAAAQQTGFTQKEAVVALDEIRRARKGERLRQRHLQPDRPE